MSLVDTASLEPARELPRAADLPQALHSRTQVSDADQGEAWLTIDERVPWQTAVRILELLKMGGRLPASALRAPLPALQPRAVALVEA